MSYELRWEIEGRVAINTLYGEVTAADVHDLRHAARELSKESSWPIHTLVDLSGITKYQTNIALMKTAIDFKSEPTIIGWTLIYGAQNPLVRFMASLLTQMSTGLMHFRFFDTKEAALEWLIDEDITLRRHYRHAAEAEEAATF